MFSRTGLRAIQFEILRQITDPQAAPARNLPAIGLVSPARIFSSVVFPEPLRPTRPTFSPGATASVTPSSNR
jgi:hypothetical protein